jgi:hypothetical protein
VEVLPLPDAPSIFFNPISNQLISNPGPGFTWTWFLNGEPILEADNQAQIDPVGNGNYFVEIINADGCSAVSADFPYSDVGIDNPSQLLRLYPNPYVSGSLFLEGIPEALTLKILDLQGREVFSTSLPSGLVKEVSPQQLIPGIYLVQIENNRGRSSSRLIVTAR